MIPSIFFLLLIVDPILSQDSREFQTKALSGHDQDRILGLEKKFVELETSCASNILNLQTNVGTNAANISKEIESLVEKIDSLSPFIFCSDTLEYNILNDLSRNKDQPASQQPELSVECLADTCLNEFSGIITSPGYPGNYENHVDTTWYIGLPVGQQVSLTFLNFHTESYDILTIYDGDSTASPTLRATHGQGIPADIISSRNEMFIRFKTDSTSTRKGFKIEYTSGKCDKDGSSNESPDWKGAGWYRFMPPAGKMMPISPPGSGRCGTAGGGWIKDWLAVTPGTTATHTVCFAHDGNNCYKEETIKVKNCGAYYLYNLPNTPGCKRYCVE